MLALIFTSVLWLFTLAIFRYEDHPEDMIKKGGDDKGIAEQEDAQEEEEEVTEESKKDN